MTYNVTGVSALMKNDKYSELLKSQKPRIALSFLLDSSGITTLVKAEATLEETIQVPVTKQKNNQTTNINSTISNSQNNSSTNDTQQDTNDNNPTATNSSDDETEIEYTSQKKVHTIPLRVIFAGSPGSIESLSLADKASSRAVLHRLSRADELKKEIAAAKNTLESYIYATRSEINDQQIETISTQEQRDAVTSALGNHTHTAHSYITPTCSSLPPPMLYIIVFNVYVYVYM